MIPYLVSKEVAVDLAVAFHKGTKQCTRQFRVSTLFSPSNVTRSVQCSDLPKIFLSFICSEHAIQSKLNTLSLSNFCFLCFVEQWWVNAVQNVLPPSCCTVWNGSAVHCFDLCGAARYYCSAIGWAAVESAEWKGKSVQVVVLGDMGWSPWWKEANLLMWSSNLVTVLNHNFQVSESWLLPFILHLLV